MGYKTFPNANHPDRNATVSVCCGLVFWHGTMSPH